MKGLHRAVAVIVAATGVAIVAGLAGPNGRLRADEPPTWGINTWPNGRVPFRFAGPGDEDRRGNAAVLMDNDTKDRVRQQMGIWEDALKVRDPADLSRRIAYIDFDECNGSCGDESHVVFRMNAPSEDNNMCTYYADADDDGRDEEHVGRNPAGDTVTVFHMDANDGVGVMVAGQTRATTAVNTIRHELGHCLGLWHDMNRRDRDAWLIETPDADTEGDWLTLFDPPVSLRGVSLMPLLGNYDYNSIMHYKSLDKNGVERWTDAVGNQFSRSNLQGVSKRDVSRVLQYYARQAQPNWGFFESLASGAADPDTAPDPMLAPGVRPVGTPAVAWQSEGNYDVFSRGSDDRIYWKSFRRRFLPRGVVNVRGAWTSLGCCFASDPSAISPAYGHVEVVAVGAVTGRPSKKRLLDDVWGGWTYVGGPLPSDIAETQEGWRVGPAIASRGANLLDVFVVLDSGNLAVSTRSAGQWTAWTEFGRNVDVSARPAALAVSDSQVRLAVNADDIKLYEPLVTFDAGSANPTISFGTRKATTAYRTAPALAARADAAQSYRVLIVLGEGRVAHKFQGGSWRDIGGIPQTGTGVTAVGDGAFGALIVMQGEDVFGCSVTCLAGQPAPGGYVQAGGVWMRRFY